MQRLSFRRRRGDDRGAVAVWVAILLVPFMIVAALAIDVAAMHADEQRLQTGADAAALAVAQHCAVTTCAGPTDAAAGVVATTLADANEPLGGPATATLEVLDPASGVVELETSSERDFWFGSFAGVEDTALSATAAASWRNYPTGGTHLPMAVSWCEIAWWAKLTPANVIRRDGAIVGLDIPAATHNVVLFSKGKKDDFHACPTGTGPNGPNGYAPPGGFGWLPATDCRATTSTGNTYTSSPGRPTTCEPAQLNEMIGRTVPIPVYSHSTEQGSSGTYHVFGYVGFTLEGFRNNKGTGPAGATIPAACTSNADCIWGTIERFADTSDDFTTSPTGPQFGTSAVELYIPTGD